MPDALSHQQQTAATDGDYWHSLISEKKAAEFVGVTDRCLQAYRQRGGGPVFVRISSRCIRYRRADLHAWAQERLRRSTSDDGAEQDAA